MVDSPAYFSVVGKSVYKLGWGNVMQRCKCANSTFGKGKSSGMEIIGNKYVRNLEGSYEALLITIGY